MRALSVRTIFFKISFCFSLFTFFFSNLHAQDEAIRWWQVMRQDKDWYASEEAIRIADNVLAYQHETGGWPKNIDMAKVLSDEDIKAIQEAKKDSHEGLGQPTIDNSATHTQMRYLAKVFDATGERRFKKSFLAGLDYLFDSQYENGGWPQFFPLKKGYYENITFNDGAMIGVMNVLREVAQGQYPFVDARRISQAQQAIDKGVEIILKTQIRVDGKLTAWCAQYDPVTLEPANARAYELVSISGAESVGVVEYLMEIENPGTEVINAINSAVDWFERLKITGIRLIRDKDESLPKGYDLVIGFDPEKASPLWARFYEIGTNYPMFVGRDSVVHYAISQIEYERRVGYSWLSDWAKPLIEKEYPNWREKWGIKNEE